MTCIKPLRSESVPIKNSSLRAPENLETASIQNLYCCQHPYEISGIGASVWVVYRKQCGWSEIPLNIMNIQNSLHRNFDPFGFVSRIFMRACAINTIHFQQFPSVISFDWWHWASIILMHGATNDEWNVINLFGAKGHILKCFLFNCW